MRRRTTTVLLLLVGALLAACGTRLDDEAFVAEQRITTVEGDDLAIGPDDDDGADATTTTAVAGGDDGPGETGGGDGGSGEGGGGGGEGGDGGPNQASDTGVTETTIRIGNITAENGALGDTFAPAVRGLRAWVEHTNANGGIRGRKIELFTCDDREDRARTLECARRLVEGDQVFAIVAANTRAMGGASQYLADQGVPVIGFPINNAYYRFPNYFNLYANYYARDGETVGFNGKIASYSGEYRWYRENLGVSKAAVFAYDVAESSQAADRFAKGLESEGFTVQRYTVSFAAPSFDQAVADMQRRGIELVYDSMDDGANRRLCDAMTRRKFTPKAKVSTVVILGDGVDANYDQNCRNVIFVPTESVPYTTASNAEVAEFRAAYQRYQPGLPFHQWALEAWAQGNIAADAIESMGPAPTRAGFIEFLDTMPANTGEGIMIGTEFAEGRLDYNQARAKDCFNIVRWQDSKGGWTLASSPAPFCVADANRILSDAGEQGT